MPEFRFVQKPTDRDRDALLDRLTAHNRSVGPEPGLHRFAYLLGPADAPAEGGLFGRIAYDWVVIELLYVPPDMRGRGIGRELVFSAERLARSQACMGIWLDSFGFQAPDFYIRLGYEVFGELPNNPTGVSRFFLRKLLL